MVKNPLLGDVRNLYLFLVQWAMIIIAHILIFYFYFNLPLYIAFADSLVFNLLFASLAFASWYTVRYLNIDASNKTSVILNHISAAIVYLFVWMLAGYLIMIMVVEENQTYFQFFKKSILWRVVYGLLCYILTIVTYYFYIYYASFKEKIIKEASLRTLIKETELSLLKSQINPHFIFNSLNSINSLTYTNPALASEMIIKLSSFLRYALEQNSRQLVSFSQEVENCLLYLDIEKTRFGERLIFEKEIDDKYDHYKIPNLILQPLLENAVKYGVYEATSPITITLSASMKDNFLHITIKNNYDKEAIPKKGKGIGLRNVKERLHLIYGHRELVKVTDNGNEFMVELFIPEFENHENN